MLKGFPGRRYNIILAAIDLINEKGIQGLSTKGIAAKQEISESILYKHFTSIDEVLVAVMKYFSRFDVMIINTICKRDIPCKEKILATVKAFVELYESYPALASIVLNYETLMRYDHTKEITRDIINKRSEFLIKIIEMAQDAGEIGDYYSALELTDIINGVLRAAIFRWKMSEYSYKLKEYTLVTIEKVLDRA